MLLFRVLSVEWVKTRRTAIWMIVTAAPVLYSLVMLSYFFCFRFAPNIQSKIYEGFFAVGASVLPILVGLLAGLMSMQEEHAGNFNGMLGQIAPRPIIYLGKFLYLMSLCVVVLFGSILILLLGMKLVLGIECIQYGLFLQGGIWALVGVLNLLALHLFLSIAFGLGASIGVGGAGFLIAAIVGSTSVGDSIWQFVPWSWPVRLSWSPILYMQNLSWGATLSPSIYYQQIIAKGLVPSVLCFIFFIVSGILWFNKWEGRKSYE